MINLNITVANKVATYCQRDGFIVCGNSDYQITFSFDSEWNAHAVKTARFKWNNTYTDVVFDGNCVDVPIFSNTSQVEIGVFAGNLCTTTPAVIPCVRSILCGEGAPVEPTPDVYSQIIDMMNDRAIQGNPGTDGKSAYEIACDNGFVGTEKEWLDSLSSEEEVADLKELINIMINYYNGVRKTISGRGNATSQRENQGYSCVFTISVEVPSLGTISDVTVDSYTGFILYMLFIILLLVIFRF